MVAPWRNRGVGIKAHKRAQSHLNYRKFVLADNFLACLEIFFFLCHTKMMPFFPSSLNKKKKTKGSNQTLGSRICARGSVERSALWLTEMMNGGSSSSINKVLLASSLTPVIWGETPSRARGGVGRGAWKSFTWPVVSMSGAAANEELVNVMKWNGNESIML